MSVLGAWLNAFGQQELDQLFTGRSAVVEDDRRVPGERGIQEPQPASLGPSFEVPHQFLEVVHGQEPM
ncbi:hypothetical protein [Pseudarthrobacter sp. BRE9]|uniref:hypothetical protein n=1 Tax=Pseudarthrobacter sp. BRE9 TaxID=2962582 RepID=UPI002881A41F|nr:hypothetical protein [Pseudarthrobacter sp. BRE9]MDT0167783.1 hypothetical protein [Pseudarthrobacter sp. BRE9]